MNTKYVAAKTITIAVAVLAAAISFTHIVELGHMHGLTGWQAWAAPVFVDGFSLLGLLAQSQSFAPETRTLGRRYQLAATLVSLVANVAAGETLGARVFGALVIAGYIAAEHLAGKMVSVEAGAAADAAARRKAASAKGVATRRANAAKAAAKPAAPKAPARRSATAAS